MKKYMPKEFMDTLLTKSFTETVMKAGLVKPVEGNKNKIAFSDNQLCNDWIEIPLEMIDSVEYVNMSSCGQESYPYVNIYFKEPGKDNAVAKVFAGLLKQSQSSDAKEQFRMIAFELFEELFMSESALRAGGGMFQPFADEYCDYVCEKCQAWEKRGGPNKDFWCKRCRGPRCKR